MDIHIPSATARPATTSGRARIACTSCHARRIKCDLGDARPCRNCAKRGTLCEPIQSRRGKYRRVSSRASGTAQAVDTTPAATINVLDAPDDRGCNNTFSSSSTTTTTTRVAHQQAGCTSIFHDGVRTPLSQNPALSRPVQDDIVASPAAAMSSPSENGDAHKDKPGMLFARMANPSPGPIGVAATRKTPRTMYLGEAFSLAYFVHTVCGSGQEGRQLDTLHYLIPTSIADGTEIGRPDILAAQEKALESLGAYILPADVISRKLTSAFMQHIYPAWPVFDRRSLVEGLQQNNLSLAVRHTVYCLAFAVCEEQLVHQAGFTDRCEARKTHFRRAKALYDMGYEPDKTLLTSILFLFCFWWENPLDEKDTWHWLGSAISLAQAQGFHRSTARSHLPMSLRSMWKRIWWSLYIRDRHAAAALGRPQHIRDDDCDVELPDQSDFSIDEIHGDDAIPPRKDHHADYFICMARLAVLMGRILSLKYSPGVTMSRQARISLVEDLDHWEKTLPPAMLLSSSDTSKDTHFWANMLHANYNTVQILLNRPRTIFPTDAYEVEGDRRACRSADVITRINEDMLAWGVIRQCQVHLAPATFAAISIHFIQIRRRHRIRGQLAENKARQCMLGLAEMSKSWPVADWIFRLAAALLNKMSNSRRGDNATNIDDTTTRDCLSSDRPYTAAQNSATLPQADLYTQRQNGIDGSSNSHSVHQPPGLCNLRDNSASDFMPDLTPDFIQDFMLQDFIDWGSTLSHTGGSLTPYSF